MDYGLVGDIGGTNARFALTALKAASDGAPGALLKPKNYAAANYPSVNEALQAYLNTEHDGLIPWRIVLAAAGPIHCNEVHFTNSPWSISSAETERVIGAESVTLTNDYAAMAMALPHLHANDLSPVGGPWRADSLEDGARLVIGPGTGLGVGLFIRANGHDAAIITEGGHSAFAPQNETEHAVWRRLNDRFGRVSNERIASGLGLVWTYEALCAEAGREPTLVQPSDVTQAALDQTDGEAETALSVFCAVLGAAAGDAALVSGAFNGVYLAGGILPRIKSFFLNSAFRERFEAKGRMGVLMEKTPTWMIEHDFAALLGAAAILTQTRDEANES